MTNEISKLLFIFFIYSVISYPFLNISANRRNAVLIKIGNGYLSKRFGNRTTDSH